MSYAEALARLSAKLSAAQELSALLHTAAFQLRQLLGCSVVVFTRPGSEAVYIASSNIGVPREELLHVRYERGDELLTRLETGEFVERGVLLPPRGVIVVPLRRREELIGFVSLGQNPRADFYGEAERDLLSAAADQLALHIENFRLRDQDWELSRVRELQERLLPKAQAGVRGYDVAHVWRPQRSVSGDYFDVIELEQDKLAVCIGDVIGKGMPAALLMSNVQAAVKAVASHDMPPSELCARVNRVLAGNLAAGNFVTFFYSMIDSRTGTLTHTNAGHTAPILARADGTVLRLENGGALLGVFKHWTFQQDTLQLEKGDRLVLFTDGITELKNDTEEEFGEDRLEQLVRRHRRAGASDLKDLLISEVANFSNGAFQDDVTVVVVAAN
jgi:sigma-B regulation protein RsbU (phosphoserine phosphatase)